MNQSWHTLSVPETVARLETGEDGLASSSIDARRQRWGVNRLPESKPPSLLKRFAQQLRGTLVLILLAAVVLSFAIGDWIEGVVILCIVLLNAFVGTLQESRAERALQALRDLSSPETTVIRDGKTCIVPTADLVVGDRVLLDAGSIVPADLRLVETGRLSIDESSLTGESVPASKQADGTVPESAVVGDRINCAFMGTTVTYGRGTGVVVAVGQKTQLGQIAESLDEPTQEPTPLQRRLDEFGRLMGWAVIGVCFLVFVVGWIRDPNLRILFSDGWAAYLDISRSTLLGLLIVAVSLAVAAVPEGLSAVVTMGLALGTRRMLERNALVRRLPSVETLGSATVICTDKTGTLTRNEMMVTGVWTADGAYEIEGTGYEPVGVIRSNGEEVDASQHAGLVETLWAALLCNDARLVREPSSAIIGDPTEGALIVAAAKAGLHPDDYRPREAEVPFDSGRKRMTTIHADQENHLLRPAHRDRIALVKGAPDEVVKVCTEIRAGGEAQLLDDRVREQILERNAAYADQGLRVLGIAYREIDASESSGTPEEVEFELTFLGLIAMHDPPRTEVAESIATARDAGLRTVMITGDHVATASAIGRQIGILREGADAISGVELDDWSDEQLADRVESIDVFARVSPRHKVRIVEALQSAGHVVAMTGDGVNDAPALKRADIGVAMGITGTDVAKQTADMVLTDDNYASIVAAVEQGRAIYANLRKTVFYLLSCNVAEILILFVATLAGWPLPLTAIQLLWLNLVTDGAPALALAVEKGEPGIMSRPPRSPRERMVDRRMAGRIAFQSSVLAAAVLGVYGVTLHAGPAVVAGSMAFATLVASELLRAFPARSETTPLLRLGLFSNRWVLLATASSGLLVLAVMYLPGVRGAFDVEPLGIGGWGIAVTAGLLPAIAMELRKAWVAQRGR